MSIVGARPQFVKLWPLSVTIGERTDWVHLIVHTGQHYDTAMSDVFFAELNMPPPAFRLGHGGGRHGAMTGAMLTDLERLMIAERPDAVVVFGDTNSTIAGALAAAKLTIPLAHVEAGLRSGVKSMPEEINRILTDHVSDLLLCPTARAVANLRREGIRDGVAKVGDLMYDAALLARGSADAAAVARTHGLGDDPYAVVTLHRAAMTDDRDRLAEAVTWLDARTADHRLIWPAHPRARAALERFELDTGGIDVVEPLPYLAMAGLVAGAQHVYTDSGGLQKEAYFHRVPCTTLRDETEWAETVAAGWNRLWRQPPHTGDRTEIADYGDGRTAAAVVDLLGELVASR